MPRPVHPADLDQILRINNANAPAVNALTREALERLVSMSHWTRVVDSEEQPVAFLLGLRGPGLDYPSDNYRWFSGRHDEFLYVDRVAVADEAQGRGIGSRLYHAFIDYARSIGIDTICAEVNTRPPNPGSHRFHERMGFLPIAEQETKGGTVRVRMYERRTQASDNPLPEPAKA